MPSVPKYLRVLMVIMFCEWWVVLRLGSHSPLAGESTSFFTILVGGNRCAKEAPTKTLKRVLAPPQGGSGRVWQVLAAIFILMLVSNYPYSHNDSASQ